MRRAGFALVGVLALLGACHRAAPHKDLAPSAQPPLWMILDATGPRAWLFGTVHALPEGVKWQGPAIVKAVQGADRLVLEVGDELSPQNAQAALAKLGYTPGLPPPSDRIAPERKADLLALYKKLGVDDRNFAGEESWAVALQLAAIASSREGVVADNGVEPGLREMAKGKPVVGLETLDAQFGAFDGLSDKDQAALLADVAQEASRGDSKDRDMMLLWIKGDTQGIATEARKGFLAEPGLRAALLTKRSNTWAQQIDAMIQSGANPFVAVGAAHVSGADGLPALMAARGYTVRRIQ